MKLFLPIPDQIEIETDGLRLFWRRPRFLEGSYVGSFIAWPQVRDADYEALPPQLRLRDGRTVFISAVDREYLVSSLNRAGVPIYHRPDVWGHLLEPFLDTDYDIVRSRYEEDLLAWGLDRSEVESIRRKVRPTMRKLTMLTWEWQYYGQADIISVYPLEGLSVSRWRRSRYQQFRHWTDDIADCPYSTSG